MFANGALYKELLFTVLCTKLAQKTAHGNSPFRHFYTVQWTPLQVCEKLFVLQPLFIVLCLSVCVQDGSCMTLTMLAAIGGQDDILRLLIKKGVRVNKRQKNGTTALMHAAEKVTLSFM